MISPSMHNALTPLKVIRPQVCNDNLVADLVGQSGFDSIKRKPALGSPVTEGRAEAVDGEFGEPHALQNR